MNNKYTSQLDNNIMSKLPKAAIEKLESIKDYVECMPMAKSYSAGRSFGESFNVAEAIVAWDPTKRAVVKIIGMYVPPVKSDAEGWIFKIEKGGFGIRQKVRNTEYPDGKGGIKSSPPAVIPGFLNHSYLPPIKGVEFRIMRAYRNDAVVDARFEILNFTFPTSPPPATMEEKKERSRAMRKSLRLECKGNVPKFILYMNDYHKKALRSLSEFTGIYLENGLGLQQQLESKYTPQQIAELTKDESEESEDLKAEELDVPGAQIDSLAATFEANIQASIDDIIAARAAGLPIPGEEDEEHYIPHNPLA
jgi:hypothetical protein